ncbi:MAG: FMN-dependent NADH-azoreductase [Nocardioides sp.]
MTDLLHISSSPRGTSSESLALAEVFLDSYRQSHPGAAVDTFDLWDGTLPAFGPPAAAAKMAVFAGREPTGEERGAWDAAVATFERFAAADGYLFSVPMWNHGIPYILKQFIDVVSQPGMVFDFDPIGGYTGLVTGKKAAVIYTGAVWGPGRGPAFGADHQRPYFDDWLRWIGITHREEVRFQPNLATDRAEQIREEARRTAREIATRF